MIIEVFFETIDNMVNEST